MRKAYSLGKACSWNPSDNPPVVELIRRSDNWSYIWKELKHFYLVVKVFGAIVGHGHNVRVVVLVVIVEAVKKEAKPNPAVNRTVYMTSGWAFCALRKQGLTKDKRLSNVYLRGSVPKSQAICTNPSPPSHFKSQIHFPPGYNSIDIWNSSGYHFFLGYQSKLVGSLLQIIPFWLLKLGVTLTLSSEAIAFPSHQM